MRIRSLVLAAGAAGALLAPHALAAPAPTPQVTDPANDANGLNGQGAVTGTPSAGTPGASQGYADVVSILWAPVTDRRKKVTGFSVTATLSAPPVAPAGTTVVYRMLSHPAGDTSLFLGPVFYTSVPSDPAQPQSALRDNLSGETRLTKIDLPKITGSTMTWTIPLKALPKEFKPGKSVSDMYFEVVEIEDFRGQKLPDALPLGYGGASGLGLGRLDVGSSTSTFKIG